MCTSGIFNLERNTAAAQNEESFHISKVPWAEAIYCVEQNLVPRAPLSVYTDLLVISTASTGFALCKISLYIRPSSEL